MFKKGNKKQTSKPKEVAQDDTEIIEAEEVKEGEEVEEITQRDKLINNYSTFKGVFESDNISSLNLLILEARSHSEILLNQNQKLDKLIELMELATKE